MTVAESVEVAGVRPEGLIPLNETDGELEEGFHVLSEATSNIRIQDLPIWYDPTAPTDPEDPDDPDKPAPPSGEYLRQALFAEYLRSMEALSQEFREMLESGGAIPEEPIQPPSGGPTFGL